MSSTGVRGVYHNPRPDGKPYYVSVRRHGVQYQLGYFATIEDAIPVHAKFVAEYPPYDRSRNGSWRYVGSGTRSR